MGPTLHLQGPGFIHKAGDATLWTTCSPQQHPSAGHTNRPTKGWTAASAANLPAVGNWQRQNICVFFDGLFISKSALCSYRFYYLCRPAWGIEILVGPTCLSLPRIRLPNASYLELASAADSFESGNPGIWESNKNKKSQNANPICPKYRRGSD